MAAVYTKVFLSHMPRRGDFVLVLSQLETATSMAHLQKQKRETSRLEHDSYPSKRSRWN